MSSDQQQRIPPWMLAPYEEKEVRKICQEQSNEKCADAFRAFAECSRQNQILFSFKCSEQKKTMIDCVAHWGSHEVFEQERNKFIERKIEKMEEEAKAQK